MFPTALLPVAHCLSFPTSSRLQPRAVRQRARARPHPTCSRSKMSGVRVREWHGCHRHPLSYVCDNARPPHPLHTATATPLARKRVGVCATTSGRHTTTGTPLAHKRVGAVCDSVLLPHRPHPPSLAKRMGVCATTSGRRTAADSLLAHKHVGGVLCNNIRPQHLLLENVRLYVTTPGCHATLAPAFTHIYIYTLYLCLQSNVYIVF
ncbi:hypothetical protein BC826DRAFT_183039 [Russula brevipes]|nr:hypothetical protein BC826DRAFT_183039 [Russula brevipes]